MTEQDIQRQQMVEEQVVARGIRDSLVIQAMRDVPRHLFLHSRPSHAYADSAQPIGEGQTISQPYIVALMTDALALTGQETVLEIGAGSGYQTAILSRLSKRVIAIERIAALAHRAALVLGQLKVDNVELIIADGSRGWASEGPYDAILVAAVAPDVPPALVQQLKPGGRLVIPVGLENEPQKLLLLIRSPSNAEEVIVQNLGAVAFVPLVGASGYGLPDDLGMMDI